MAAPACDDFDSLLEKLKEAHIRAIQECTSLENAPVSVDASVGHVVVKKPGDGKTKSNSSVLECEETGHAHQHTLELRRSESRLTTYTQSACSSSASASEKLRLQDERDLAEQYASLRGHPKAKAVVSHFSFEIISATAILLNALLVTIFTDYALANDGDAFALEPAVESLFLAFFCLELLARIAAHGPGYFHGEAIAWRVLDLIVVLAGLLDIILTTSGWNPWINISFIRSLRLLRMLRLFKNADKSKRVRLLVHLLSNLGGSLFVTFAFGAFVLFLFASFFTQTMAMNAGKDSLFHDETLMQRWGSTEKAIWSLFSAATSGQEWGVLAGELLDKTGPVPCIVLIGFICAFVFFFANVVTAMFVQSTLMAMKGSAARELEAQIQFEQRESYIREVSAWFGADIDKEEFEASMESLADNTVVETNSLVKSQSQCQALKGLRDNIGVSEVDMKRMFSYLSIDDEAGVNTRQFVLACILHKESVSQLDLLELVLQQRELLRRTTGIENLLPRTTGIENLVMTTDFSEGSSLGTIDHVRENPLHIQDVQSDEFVDEVLYQATTLKPLNTDDNQLDEFTSTLNELLILALECKGGAGFVLCPSHGYSSLQARGVQFQACDIGKGKYAKGYMTHKTTNLNIKDVKFKQIIKEFANPELQDEGKWPVWHEAANLPKDGFTLLSIQGTRRLCAARLLGLTVAPFSWDRVGTRHLTAMNIAWALKGHLFAVVVRSDAGAMHAFLNHPTHGFKCFRDAQAWHIQLQLAKST